METNKLALTGGAPLVKNHSSLRGGWPLKTEADYLAIKEAYDCDDFSGRGSKAVATLEKIFSEKHNNMYATAVNSGTAALHAALVALGIEPGDEVIVPNLTFVATAAAVLHNLAVPIFVDIDPITYNMSPIDLEKRISPRTKAIIVVHMHGFPAQMDKIMEICKRHNLKLIEDVAQAPGATFEGQLLGTLGDASAFSLMSQKNIATCGEGGVLLTKTLEQKNKAEMLRIYGEIIGEDGSRMYNSYSLGWNYTLNPIQAAMAVAQLKGFDELTARIQEKGRQLNDGLRQFTWVEPPLELPSTTGVFHFYRVRVGSNLFTGKRAGLFRCAVQNALNAEGLNVRLYQNTPVSGQVIFREKKAYGRGLPWSLNPEISYDYTINDYPNTLDVLRSTLVLGAISSAPGYLLRKGAVEAYIKGFAKLDSNMDKLIDYANEISDYKDPWENIPVTSDSFSARYGIKR